MVSVWDPTDRCPLHLNSNNIYSCVIQHFTIRILLIVLYGTDTVK